MQGYENAPISRGRRDSPAAFWLIVAVLCATLSACGSGGGGGGGSLAAAPFISAGLISFPTGAVPPGFVPAGFNSVVSVDVRDNSNGPPITNASVSINGVALPYDAASQTYQGVLTVAAGNSITLSVVVGGVTYTSSVTQFSSYPTISAPVAGSTWSLRSANLVAWSGGAPTTRSVYALGVLDSADPSRLIWPAGDALLATATATTSFTIDSGSLTAGSRLVIVGIVTGADIPNAAPNSGIAIGGFNYVPITVSDGVGATLLSIAVTPQVPAIAKGKTQQLTATGTYSDTSSVDVTMRVTWTSSDTAKATVSATGLVSGTGVGPATITATSGGILGSTSVNVVAGFLPGVNYPDVSPSFLVGDTAVGDLNGDGRNDVAVLEQRGTRILIYLGNAGGTLDSPQVITTDLSLTGIAIADVNNDGLADLIVSGNSTTATSGLLGRIAVFRQDSVSHALGAPQEYLLSTNIVGPLAVADLNGDSLPDVVAAGTSGGNNGVGTISLLFQGAAGVLGPEVTYTNVPVVADGELHVADMNHDGSNDIVLQSGDKQLAVIKQVSPGTFSTTPDFYAVQVSWPWFRSFVLADLNGDGRIDVVVATVTGELNIFYQDANGTLTGPTILGYAADEVKVADLNGDGLNDIIQLIDGNQVTILYQWADHSFQNPVTYILPTYSTGGTTVHQAMSVGDVTGDGLPDIVASWLNEGIFVLPRMP